MLGIAESYLGALAVELGHRDVALALLASAPLCIGFAAQLLAGPLVVWFGGRKRLVMVGATVQAITHVGFAAIAWVGSESLAAFLLIKTLYFVSGLIIGPPWGAWMSSLVSGRAREQYFSRRSAVVQLMLLVSFVSAGILLHGAEASSPSTLWMFAILNLAGLVARTLSVACLAVQADFESAIPSRYDWRALRSAVQDASWKVPIYIAVLLFGAHTAVPFFTPYMLRDLGLDYATYATLTSVPIAVKAITSPFLYWAARRFGMRSLFMTSTGLISIVSLLWGLDARFEMLVAAQLLSGIAWGAFEYASYQLLLQAAPSHARVEFLSLANALAGAAQLSGAIIGGMLLLGEMLDYQAVFILSAFARALPIAIAVVVIPQKMPRLSRIALRVIAVRPSGGTVARPIIGSSDEDASQSKESD